MSTNSEATVLVTGASGTLGSRLLDLLQGQRVIAVGTRPPRAAGAYAFESLDLGREVATNRLIEIIRESAVTSVVHLAFVDETARVEKNGQNRHWQINVAGTGRLMEAITEVNRRRPQVQRLILRSSASAYGPESKSALPESASLKAHTLLSSTHAAERDRVVQFWSESVGSCATYILRPQTFAGADATNYFLGLLRGDPAAPAKSPANKQTRMPLPVPFGTSAIRKLCQFVHVDDMARLIAFILTQPENPRRLTVFNVAGRGEPLTLEECAEIAEAKLVRLPEFMCRWTLERRWKAGLSPVPPEAAPYLYGSCLVDTTASQRFLGSDYTRIIQHTNREALADSFASRDEDVSEQAGSTFMENPNNQ